MLATNTTNIADQIEALSTHATKLISTRAFLEISQETELTTISDFQEYESHRLKIQTKLEALQPYTIEKLEGFIEKLNLEIAQKKQTTQFQKSLNAANAALEQKMSIESARTQVDDLLRGLTPLLFVSTISCLESRFNEMIENANNISHDEIALKEYVLKLETLSEQIHTFNKKRNVLCTAAKETMAELQKSSTYTPESDAQQLEGFFQRKFDQLVKIFSTKDITENLLNSKKVTDFFSELESFSASLKSKLPDATQPNQEAKASEFSSLNPSKITSRAGFNQLVKKTEQIMQEWGNLEKKIQKNPSESFTLATRMFVLHLKGLESVQDFVTDSNFNHPTIHSMFEPLIAHCIDCETKAIQAYYLHARSLSCDLATLETNPSAQGLEEYYGHRKTILVKLDEIKPHTIENLQAFIETLNIQIAQKQASIQHSKSLDIAALPTTAPQATTRPNPILAEAVKAANQLIKNLKDIKLNPKYKNEIIKSREETLESLLLEKSEPNLLKIEDFIHSLRLEIDVMTQHLAEKEQKKAEESKRTPQQYIDEARDIIDHLHTTRKITFDKYNYLNHLSMHALESDSKDKKPNQTIAFYNKMLAKERKINAKISINSARTQGNTLLEDLRIFLLSQTTQHLQDTFNDIIERANNRSHDKTMPERYVSILETLSKQTHHFNEKKASLCKPAMDAMAELKDFATCTSDPDKQKLDEFLIKKLDQLVEISSANDITENLLDSPKVTSFFAEIESFAASLQNKLKEMYAQTREKTLSLEEAVNFHIPASTASVDHSETAMRIKRKIESNLVAINLILNKKPGVSPTNKEKLTQLAEQYNNRTNDTLFLTDMEKTMEEIVISCHKIAVEKATELSRLSVTEEADQKLFVMKYRGSLDRERAKAMNNFTKLEDLLASIIKLDLQLAPTAEMQLKTKSTLDSITNLLEKLRELCGSNHKIVAQNESYVRMLTERFENKSAARDLTLLADMERIAHSLHSTVTQEREKPTRIADIRVAVEYQISQLKLLQLPEEKRSLDETQNNFYNSEIEKLDAMCEAAKISSDLKPLNDYNLELQRDLTKAQEKAKRAIAATTAAPLSSGPTLFNRLKGMVAGTPKPLTVNGSDKAKAEPVISSRAPGLQQGPTEWS